MQRQDDKGRQGNRQQNQHNDNRPQQERDLQRNKQSDLQRNKQSDRGQQRQGGSDNQQTAAPSGSQQRQGNVYGEGNYAASKQYNDATREFVQSGRVEEAARNAAPQSDADALDMQAAEAEGKRHAKEEDPALERKRSRLPSDMNDAPKPGKD